MRRVTISVCVALIFVGILSAGKTYAESASGEALRVQPASLERTLFSKAFHELTITGSCPEGSQIVLKIVGPARSYKLNKSGKGLGFVWLPVDHAEVKDIPGMYALISSSKISGMLSTSEQEAAGLDPEFTEVHGMCKVCWEKSPPEDKAVRLRQEYISGLVQIFSQNGLYINRDGGVHVDGCAFSATLAHPVAAPLGEYRVFCYAVKDGKVKLLCQDRFLVKSKGIAYWLAEGARTNPGVYGILAAAVAIAAGLLIGAVFGRGYGH